jgi:hypothetical protein
MGADESKQQELKAIQKQPLIMQISLREKLIQEYIQKGFLCLQDPFEKISAEYKAKKSQLMRRIEGFKTLKASLNKELESQQHKVNSLLNEFVKEQVDCDQLKGQPLYRKGTEEYGKAFERQADRTNELLDADSKFWQVQLEECNKEYNDQLMRFFAAV